MSRIVQFTQLGNFGRFGNQLFQYAFARAYAEKYDAVLETPTWIGEEIFNIPNTPLSCKLPTHGVDVIPWGTVNIDLLGYFQTKDCFSLLSKRKLKEWFVFQDRWLPYLKPTEEVVAHSRVGDYATFWSAVFCRVSKKSFVEACLKFDIPTEKLVYLTEENPTIDESLNDVSYSKVSNSMYGTGCYLDNGISFLADFFRMINSKVLLRGNSTFSFWAGFFKGENVYSPMVQGKVGLQDVEFVEGNESAICNNTDDIIIGE